MSRNKNQKKRHIRLIPQNKPHPTHALPPVSSTMLDKMVDGREFESLLKYQYQNLNVTGELQKSLQDIKAIRKRPVVCYVANVVKPTNSSISIDDSDDLPFNEMIASLPHDAKEIDIVLVTPGGFCTSSCQIR